MADITVLILTYNEEKNIEECIKSVKRIAKRIVVIDSYSTDNTVCIAKEMGVEVIQHEFVNQAKQFIYALDTINIKTTWVLRLDADERLTENSSKEIEKLCDENMYTDVNGLVVRFTVNFLGKELKHGGIYPFRKLIVFKPQKGHMEDRNMDEHIVLDEGYSIDVKSDSIHHDFKSMSAWIDKHNKYSDREVLDYYLREELKGTNKKLNFNAKIKRFVKMYIYYRLPLGTRAHLYYIYRYYIKLGFLDGKAGKVFAFMQAYWYRYLVDAKIYEKEQEKKK